LVITLGWGVAARHLLTGVTSEDPSGDLAPGGCAAGGFRVPPGTEHGAEPHDKASRDHDHDDDGTQGGC